MLAFAGLSADARVLVDYARRECESYKLSLEDPVTIGHIARCIADVKQEYTQTTGRRPFGISMLIGGFDYDGTPRLFKTEPSGVYFEYMASSIGRNEKQIREYLEEHYNDENTASEATAWIASKTPEFYERGIDIWPQKWELGFEYDGEYPPDE